MSTSQYAFPKATTCHGLDMKYLLKGPIIELKSWFQRTVLFGDIRIWGLAGKINHWRLVLASLSCPRFFLCFPSAMSNGMIPCPESVVSGSKKYGLNPLKPELNYFSPLLVDLPGNCKQWKTKILLF